MARVESDQTRVLVVGAGFAGGVYARELAERGFYVVVIDKRNHIAGNAFDEVIGGIRVHRYGPHLFHTDNETVVGWLSRFTEWLPYEHRVRARLSDGRLVPLPINRTTVADTLGVGIPNDKDLEEILQAICIPHKELCSAKNYLESKIGVALTETFFGRYTNKMWGRPLDRIPPSVVKRVGIRLGLDDRYFSDKFQAIPKRGYTKLFENIFDHDNISLQLGRAFDRRMERDFAHVFNSMAIDEYFEFELGHLPYRSIRFHNKYSESDTSRGCVVINYTDKSAFTRETHWHNIPGAGSGERYIVTIEEPCSYDENSFERYYPMRTLDGSAERAYEEYNKMAKAISDKITFIGRCGTYRYLDMHQVVNQSLSHVQRWATKMLRDGCIKVDWEKNDGEL
jgi:UDP-galactopyranose mutase